MSKPPTGRRGSPRAPRPPEFFFKINGWKYRVRVLARPSPRTPAYAIVCRAPDCPAVLVMEPVLDPAAIADDFEGHFERRLSMYAAHEAGAFLRGKSPRPELAGFYEFINRRTMRNDLIGIVRNALESDGPESTRKPTPAPEPEWRLGVDLRLWAGELLRHRATAFGPFTEDQAARLEAIAGRVAETQAAALDALAPKAAESA